MFEPKRGRNFARAKKAVGDGQDEILEQIEFDAAELDNLEDIESFLETPGGQALSVQLKNEVADSIVNILQCSEDYNELLASVENLRATLRLMTTFARIPEEKAIIEDTIENIVEQSKDSNINSRPRGNYYQQN